LIVRERDNIVAQFVRRVRGEELAPEGLTRTLLVDHIPHFLDGIVEVLSRDVTMSGGDAPHASAIAKRHGEQRWDIGYDFDALMREYGVLWQCILGSVKGAGLQLSVDDFDALARCMNIGVVEAANEYVLLHDEQLKAQRDTVSFLAEAGRLLSSSLDYRWTLTRLTALLVPRLADCCAIHLEGWAVEDVALAHADQGKLELLQELYRRFPPPESSPYGYPAVVRAEEAQLMPEVPADFLETVAQGPEHLALLQALGICSWIVVPLRVQDHIFGAIVMMHTDSRRRYGQEDLLLAQELAGRASSAIDNARLYELAQRERSKVEAATRTRDEFLAIVSHELRTPLNAILGWVRLLRGGQVEPAKQSHALEVIERNADAQNRLVGDLLDVSSSVTGRLRIHTGQLNMCDVVDMAIEGIRPAAAAKQISIETTFEREHAFLRGDAERLQQVVWNLLVNAVKFTPKHGVVRVRVSRVASELQLDVEDTGIGIEPAFLPHMFELFRQSEMGTARAHGGLGIGLSIAKQLVELHGGSIAAHSAGKGLGATFRVRLPVSSLASPTMGVSRIPAALGAPPAAQKLRAAAGIRVLVVDDDSDARDLLKHVLEGCGAEVTEAPSAADALAVLDRYIPDVLVSDVGMPGQDGYSLIRRIRTLPNEALRSLPAIALTAFSRNEDRTRALVAGFSLHLTKPADSAALLEAIIELAGDARQRASPVGPEV
jgi:signal transduction histidine kinase/ActR/RegA family two-component response regulator